MPQLRGDFMRKAVYRVRGDMFLLRKTKKFRFYVKDGEIKIPPPPMSELFFPQNSTGQKQKFSTNREYLKSTLLPLKPKKDFAQFCRRMTCRYEK